ncbi:MAG TPA: outer membrane protein [Methylocella sp.]|nr:outer membrane protein [Methylocella sp.]
MYRKFLLASVGAIALTGSAAFAADLPSRAPPPVYLPPPPIFTWTGIYIGGQVGYAWFNGSNRFNGFDPFFNDGQGIFLNSSVGGTPNGVIGGGHVGYDYQINQWVLGVEGTVDGTSLTNTAVAVFPDGSVLRARSNADIQGSIRGRLGIAWDRALIYATGGVAFGGFNTNVSFNGTDFATGVPFFANANVSSTRTGWTVGGGIDYAVTNNWSIFAEYRFTNFGNIRENNFGQLPAGFTFNERRQLQQNQVQAGFSYKFDWYTPPPIVAKY